MRRLPQWRWRLDEVFVRINGETYYLWRAVDHEGEVLEVFVTKRRDRRASLRFLKKVMKRYGRARVIVTDRHISAKSISITLSGRMHLAGVCIIINRLIKSELMAMTNDKLQELARKHLWMHFH